MSVLDVINSAAAVATATGIAFGVDQVLRSRRQRMADFEQRFVDEYRSVVRRIPLEMLPGENDYDPSDQCARRAFHDYFELCEDEAFQARQRPRRVSEVAWAEWRDGINSNMSRPAFQAAWLDLGEAAPEQFDELREAGLVSVTAPSDNDSG